MVDLRKFDGVPIRHANLPHPVDLARWQEDGLIEIDADNSVLRLTERGRQLAEFDYSRDPVNQPENIR